MNVKQTKSINNVLTELDKCKEIWSLYISLYMDQKEYKLISV